MHTRKLSMTLLGGAFALLIAVTGATFPQPPASAEPPPVGDNWPMCADDPDGQHCVVWMKRGVDLSSTVPIEHPAAGDYYVPEVYYIGDGIVGFYVNHYRDGAPLYDGELPRGDVYDIKVNTGTTIVPRALFAFAEDATFERGIDNGNTFRITLRPTPVAWVLDDDTCTFEDCGDDTTTADPASVFEGNISGTVEDLSTWGNAAETEMMTGRIHASNAQKSDVRYDDTQNTLVIRLANPHLQEADKPATGAFQAFLPYAMLEGMMGVPNPPSIADGSIIITRDGSRVLDFILTHRDQGVDIRVTDFTYSTPTYRIKPRKTEPGQPLLRRVLRVAPKAVVVRFAKPLADGGSEITRYRARCRTGSAAWHYASATASPMRVANLPRTTVTCQVRAINGIGAGPWSLPKKG